VRSRATLQVAVVVFEFLSYDDDDGDDDVYGHVSNGLVIGIVVSKSGIYRLSW
jgi:hypothetical protein